MTGWIGIGEWLIQSGTVVAMFRAGALDTDDGFFPSRSYYDKKRLGIVLMIELDWRMDHPIRHRCGEFQSHARSHKRCLLSSLCLLCQPLIRFRKRPDPVLNGCDWRIYHPTRYSRGNPSQAAMMSSFPLNSFMQTS